MRTLRVNGETIRTVGKWEITTYRTRHDRAASFTVTISGPGGERCLSIRAQAGRSVVAVARIGWSNAYPWVPVYRRVFGYGQRTTGFAAPYVGSWLVAWTLADRDGSTRERRFGRTGRRRTFRPQGGWECSFPPQMLRTWRARRKYLARLAAADQEDTDG